MMVVDHAAGVQAPLTVRFACLCHDLGKGLTPPAEWPRHIAHEARSVRLVQDVCKRLRVPTDCKALAEVVAREHGNVHRSGTLNAASVVRLLDRCDAWRRPDRFAEMLLACECDARGRLGLEANGYPQRPLLQQALDRACAVDTRAVAEATAARGRTGPDVGKAITAARVEAVREGIAEV
jgi:tRNA nucleotidyltransferase (CCA-adding enzyme)